MQDTRFVSSWDSDSVSFGEFASRPNEKKKENFSPFRQAYINTPPSFIVYIIKLSISNVHNV